MSRKIIYVIMHIARLAMVGYVIYWGVEQYNEFPLQIGCEFDTAGKVIENGNKMKFLPMFIFLAAGFIPIKSATVEDEASKMKEKRNALLLSFAHSILMCAIFMWRVHLIKNNLAQ